jgi:hypothetical protein
MHSSSLAKSLRTLASGVLERLRQKEFFPQPYIFTMKTEQSIFLYTKFYYKF